MRAPSWIKAKRIKVNDPPQVKARNVYDLSGILGLDRVDSVRPTVLVVAPGPSFATFPKEELTRHTTIGVNAALELFEPTYWLYAEPFFTKSYRDLYADGRPRRIVTTRWQAFSALERLLPKGNELYWFRYGHAPRLDPEDNLSVLKMSHAKPTDRTPWWALPEVGFLPGRCSVATHAVSLALLMGAKTVITIGVDFRFDGEDYYAPGVKINPGPGKGVAKGMVLGKRRTKALACGRAWADVAAKRGVWQEIEVLTISERGGFPGAKRVTVEEAVERLK